MSPPWLGRDWHLAGNLDDVTVFAVYPRYKVGFGSRWVATWTATRADKGIHVLNHLLLSWYQRNMCNVYFGWQGRVLPPLIANPKTSNPILTPKNHLRLLLFLQTCKVLWESEVLIQNPSISKGTRELYVTVMSLYDFMAATKLLLCNNCKSVYMVIMEVTLFLIRGAPNPIHTEKSQRYGHFP